MKKIITLWMVLLVSVSGNSILAQNLAIQNATMTLVGPDSMLLAASATIVNTGSSNAYVKVARTATNLVPGHITYFCWVACYSAATTLSPDSILLAPGASTSAFVADVLPRGFEGQSTVTYVFFDSNPSDSAFVTFNYQFQQAVGINELSAKPVIQNAYPNPADGFTGIAYNLHSAKEAKVVLYNLLGTVVKEMKLTEKQSTMTFSTADLKSGIYFYSLIVDDKSLSSKKLIVAHR